MKAQPTCIDGFAHPIPRKHLNAYRQLAASVARLWIEHGALDYREYVSQDAQANGVLPFANAIDAAEGEVVVFGWVEFASREMRDAANLKVASDPRAPSQDDLSRVGFRAERMAYGAFVPLVETSAGSGG